MSTPLLASIVAASTVALLPSCSATTPATTATPSQPSSPMQASAPTLDDVLGASWAKAGVVPSSEIDDATFLRRATMDLLGRIPSSDEVRAFLAVTAPTKRRDLVDRLLQNPEHAKYLSRIWDAILLGPQTKQGNVDRGAFDRWLELRFSQKTPWDKIVYSLVTATGQSSTGAARGAENFTGGIDKAKEEEAAGVNASVNFVLRHARAPADLAGQVSKNFLGVQIQCAQCHDHKTEKWKQDDFRSFARAFTEMRQEQVDREKGQIPVLQVDDLTSPSKKQLRDPEFASMAKAPPRALDGTDLSGGANLRDSLAAWMVSKKNPWFAKAMVNRVWAQVFGSAFVDPPDDFGEKNPPLMPEVLDRLADDFIAQNFDLDSLYREILGSRAYLRSSEKASNSARDALFSHSDLVGMNADQVLDSIFTATDVDDAIDRAKKVNGEAVKIALRRKIGFVFDEDSESNSEGFDGTVQQALFLMNGGLTASGTSVVPQAALFELFDRGASDDVIIDDLYLRTLSRLPREDERTRWKEFLKAPRHFELPNPSAAAKGKVKLRNKRDPLPRKLESLARSPREQAFEDMFWALLNSSEFFFRR